MINIIFYDRGRTDWRIILNYIYVTFLHVPFSPDDSQGYIRQILTAGITVKLRVISQFLHQLSIVHKINRVN